MIVGPTILATCPMLGPMNASVEPQTWVAVPPAGPFPEGAFVPQP
jgi:hypothetical protein